MNTQIVDEILVRSFFVFLLVGSVAGLFTGISLLLRPAWFLRWSGFVNRWVSTRHWMQVFSRPVELETWFYRHNKLCGSFLLVGSLMIIYFILDGLDKHYVLKNVFNVAFMPTELMAGLLDGLVLFSIMASVFIAMLSLYLLYRPSMLRNFELRANKHTSLRKSLKPLETPRAGLDRYLIGHQRLVGGLILTGSIYTLTVLAANLKVIL